MLMIHLLQLVTARIITACFMFGGSFSCRLFSSYLVCCTTGLNTCRLNVNTVHLLLVLLLILRLLEHTLIGVAPSNGQHAVLVQTFRDRLRRSQGVNPTTQISTFDALKMIRRS